MTREDGERRDALIARTWCASWCTVAVIATGAFAQSGRRLATIDGLRQFPGFYHLQQVLVRGELVEVGPRLMLRTEEHEMRLLPPAGTRVTPDPVDVRAVLIDVGRLEPGDARLTGYDRPDDDRWPKPGEELYLKASSISPRTPGEPLSMRALVLEPWRFEGQAITLVGQFRGRNLFGDVPGAPRKSQHDFVLKSGDAAMWVVGMRPRGKDFDLDIDARVDTKQWLEVTGVAKRTAGLVTIEATRILAASEPSRTMERDEPAPPPPPLAPVEVVFSSPTAGETDVPSTTPVRIQFSRNIKPETLKSRVRVSYVGSPADQVEPPAAPFEWRSSYDPATRALELTFGKPLDKFRTVKVELLEGILGFDGAPLVPWGLTFMVGN